MYTFDFCNFLLENNDFEVMALLLLTPFPLFFPPLFLCKLCLFCVRVCVASPDHFSLKICSLVNFFMTNSMALLFSFELFWFLF